MRISEKEVLNELKVTGADHEEREWIRVITFTWKDTDYRCELMWSESNGYEMLDWGDMPENLIEAADGFIYSLLDELSFNFMEKERERVNG